MNIKRKRIKLSDGSSWPRPALDRDDEVSLEWKLRYQPQRPFSPNERMEAAEIIAAYNHLMAEADRSKVELVIKEVRQALREECA